MTRGQIRDTKCDVYMRLYLILYPYFRHTQQYDTNMAKVRVYALKSESNLKLHAMKLAFFMNIRSWADEHRFPPPENIGS